MRMTKFETASIDAFYLKVYCNAAAVYIRFYTQVKLEQRIEILNVDNQQYQCHSYVLFPLTSFNF